MYIEDVEDRSNTPKGCNDKTYHQILCMLKHVKDVEDYLRHL